MSRDRNAHLSELRNIFPQAKILKEAHSDLLLSIQRDVCFDGNSTHPLILLVGLSPSFPQTAPNITMPYNFFKVPITEIEEENSEKPEWDPATSSLAECVQNAFANLEAYWKPVAPPSIPSIIEQLNQETDRLLQDLGENSNCLEAYCYQLPIMKQMREVRVCSANELESLVNSNLALRGEVDALYNEVKGMKNELYNQVNELQQAEQNKLIISVCSPEALSKSLEGDLRKLHEKSKIIGKTALEAYGNNKTAFQESFEEYRANCKKIHEIDLKLRAFRATVS